MNPAVTILDDLTLEDVSAEDIQVFAEELAKSYLAYAKPVLYENMDSITVEIRRSIEDALEGRKECVYKCAIKVGQEIVSLAFITTAGKTKDERVIYEIGTGVTKPAYRQRGFNDLVIKKCFVFLEKNYSRNPIIVQTNNPIVKGIHERKGWKKVGTKERYEFWDNGTASITDPDVVKEIEQMWQKKGYSVYYFDPLQESLAAE